MPLELKNPAEMRGFLFLTGCQEGPGGSKAGVSGCQSGCQNDRRAARPTYVAERADPVSESRTASFRPPHSHRLLDRMALAAAAGANPTGAYSNARAFDSDRRAD